MSRSYGYAMTGIDIPRTYGNGSVGIVVLQALHTPRTGRQGQSWAAVAGGERDPIAGAWGKDKEPGLLPDCSKAVIGDRRRPCQSAGRWDLLPGGGGAVGGCGTAEVVSGG